MLKLPVKGWTKTTPLAVPLDKGLAGNLGHSVYGRGHIYNRVGRTSPFSLLSLPSIFSFYLYLLFVIYLLFLFCTFFYLSAYLGMTSYVYIRDSHTGATWYIAERLASCLDLALHSLLLTTPLDLFLLPYQSLLLSV